MDWGGVWEKEKDAKIIHATMLVRHVCIATSSVFRSFCFVCAFTCRHGASSWWQSRTAAYTRQFQFARPACVACTSHSRIDGGQEDCQKTNYYHADSENAQRSRDMVEWGATDCR